MCHCEEELARRRSNPPDFRIFLESTGIATSPRCESVLLAMTKIMNLTPLHLAYDSLRRQKRRTLLTMLAITIGSAAVITIMAAGKGVERFVLGQLDAFGPDTLSIETQVSSAKHNGGGFGSVGITITTMKDIDLETVRRHPNILAAYGMVSGQEAVSYQGQLKKVLLMGHGYATPDVEKFDMSSGRFYTREEEDGLAQVAVLGATAKEKLFGDEDAVNKIIYIRGKPFRVVGVEAKRGAVFFFDLDNMISLPTKTMQKKLLGIDYIQQIIARMRDGSKSKETSAELADLIRANHYITDSNHDDFVVNTTVDAQTTLTKITGGITLLLVALVGISLLVGGVGIMNIMYVSVAERTFEIGLRKAVGATARDIQRQFLSEAVLTTVGGGVAGIILGMVLALIIYFAATSLGFKWVYSISLISIMLAIGFSAGVGVLFGWYPAKKAARLNPMDALGHE